LKPSTTLCGSKAPWASNPLWPSKNPSKTTNPTFRVLIFDERSDQQIAQLKFFKDGHTGIYAEVRINGGAWLFLANSDQSPILDDRPLLVPGQAEVRQYRFRFFDDGQAHGAWSDTIKVTVGP